MGKACYALILLATACPHAYQFRSSSASLRRRIRSAMQPAKRRPATYGKKSQQHTFAKGLDSLSDRSPPKTPSKLHVPAASPAKVRRLQLPSPSDPFDVPSSGDETTQDAPPKSPVRKRLPSQPAQPEETKRSKSTALLATHRSPAPAKARTAAAVNRTTKRKRPNGYAAAETTLSPSSTGSPMKVDSPIFSPSTPLATTPELEELALRTPDTQVRKALSTPKQNRLWTDLLDDEPSSDGPATQLRHLSLASSTARALQSATQTMPRNLPTRKLVDRLMPSEDSELLLSDDNTTLHSDDTDDTEQLREALDSSFSQPLAPAPRTTYAQQRTYIEDNTSFEDLLAQPLDDGVESGLFPTQVGSSQRSMPSLDGPDDDDETARGLRSIHELRAGGDARRFDDEVRRLLEDVVDSPDLTISSQRSGILTIASKLEEKLFRQRFVQGSYEQQFFAVCVRNDDVICSTALAAAVVFLLQSEPENGRAAVHALHSISIKNFQPALAAAKGLETIAKERRTNMSRLAQKSVTEFQGLLLGTGIFASSGTSTLSPQQVALKALDLIVRRSRGAGYVDSILTPSLIEQLINIGLSVLPGLPGEAATVVLQDVLSILESSTIAASRGTDSSLITPDVVATAIPLLEAAIRPSSPSSHEAIGPLALKLCLNLTNNHEANSDAFDASAFVSILLENINSDLAMVPSLLARTDEARIGRQFDSLILSLGAMMNLAEMSVLVRRSVEQKQRGAFDTLVESFIRNRDRTGEMHSLGDASLQIAFGYAAILLANLAQNSRLRARIVAKLPNGDVQVLVDAVEEFIGHNQEADRQGNEGPEWVAFTRRLQAVVDSLKEVVSA